MHNHREYTTAKEQLDIPEGWTATALDSPVPRYLQGRYSNPDRTLDVELCPTVSPDGTLREDRIQFFVTVRRYTVTGQTRVQHGSDHSQLFDSGVAAVEAAEQTLNEFSRD